MLLNVSTNQLYSYLLCKQVEDDIVVEASVKVSQIVLCGREREEEREGRGGEGRGEKGRGGEGREEGERKGRKKGEREVGRDGTKGQTFVAANTTLFQVCNVLCVSLTSAGISGSLLGLGRGNEYTCTLED